MALPYDINGGSGSIKNFITGDRESYIPYTKLRGNRFYAHQTSILTALVPNVTLTVDQLIYLIYIRNSGFNCNFTLPGTDAIVTYMQRVGYFDKDDTSTSYSFHVPIYMEPSNAQRVLIAGDSRTTFPLFTPDDRMKINAGYTYLRCRVEKNTMIPPQFIIKIDIEGSSTSPSIPINNIPLYSPYPTDDSDQLLIYDASDGFILKRISKQNFFKTNSITDNLLIGPGSNYSMTGDFNLAVGISALASNTTGDNNVAVGYRTLGQNTTGTKNIAIGRQALEFNTTGGPNIAIGDNALNNTTSGVYNIAIGEKAGFLLTGALSGANVLVGDINGAQLTTDCAGNTFIGQFVGRAATGCSYNTGVGNLAFNDQLSGDYNIAIGRGSASALIDGENNILIGSAVTAHVDINSQSNVVMIGPFNNALVPPPVSNTMWIPPNLVSPNVATQLYYDVTTGQVGPAASTQRVKSEFEEISQELIDAFDKIQPVIYLKHSFRLKQKPAKKEEEEATLIETEKAEEASQENEKTEEESVAEEKESDKTEEESTKEAKPETEEPVEIEFADDIHPPRKEMGLIAENLDEVCPLLAVQRPLTVYNNTLKKTQEVTGSKVSDIDVRAIISLLVATVKDLRKRVSSIENSQKRTRERIRLERLRHGVKPVVKE